MPEDFEDQLREALRRRDPSSGFAERVIARANPARRARPAWAIAAIAAMLAVGVFGFQEYQQRRAEDARRQAMLALSITAKKLNLFRDKVLRMERENQ
jgi:type VI protein secretion system component VasF